MKQDGVTLIELLVVVAIISILAVVLGFQYVGWIQRYKAESQIKTMQSDLSAARQRAIEKNIQYVVQISAPQGTGYTSYTICEDTNSNNVCDAPGETTQSPVSQLLSKTGLGFPITWNLAGGAGAQIVMTSGGLIKIALGADVSDTASNLLDISNTSPYNIWLLEPSTMTAYISQITSQLNYYGNVDYDCISVSSLRIGVGKYDGDGTQTSCKTAGACCVK